jgi:Domain of unknown function (DUF4272)
MSRLSESIGGDPTDQTRSAVEIARRSLALGAAVARSFDAPRDELLAFVGSNNLLPELTSREHEYLFSTRRSKAATIRMSWDSERLVVLLWAINKIDQIPGPGIQCSTSALADVLPPFGLPTIESFMRQAKRRSERVLFEMASQIQEQHAVAIARSRNSNYRPEQGRIDREIVQERHRAINWVVGYCGLEWDEVTADT